MSRQSQSMPHTSCIFLIGLLAGAASSPAAPPDLAGVVPESTLIYVGRPGGDHTDDALKGTAPGDMLADEEIKRFNKDLWRVIDALLLREVGNRDSDVEAYEAGKELLIQLERRPTALALLDGGFGEQGPFVRAALICHLGNGEKAFMRRLDAFLVATKTQGHDIVTLAGKPMKQLDLMSPFPIYYGVIDRYFVLAVGNGTVEQLVESMEGSSGSLAAGKRLLLARKKMAGDVRTRTLTVHVDVAGLMKRAEQILPMFPGGGGEQVEHMMRISSALGVDSLKSITWENHLTKRGCYSGIYLHAPKGRGLLSSQAGKALTDADLSVIPKSPSWAAAYNLDLVANYRSILSIMAMFDAEVHADLTQGIRNIEETLGFTLDEGILQLVGGTVVLFDAPDSGGLLFTGINVLVESSKPKLLQKRLRTIAKAIGKTIGGETVLLSSFNHRGHWVDFVNVVGVPMPLAPAWTVHDQWVILALYPQMVTATLDRLMDGDPKKDSILANPDFIAAREVTGDWGWSVSYMDSKAAIANLYPYALLLAQVGAAMAQGEGIAIDISTFPSLKAVTQHLFADVKTTRTDPDGILCASYGPLPFAPSPAMTSNLGTTALLTSILLPALSRARELAKRTVCATNMRGIGQAMYLHAAEDDYGFPKDFETLIEENNVTVRQFACPSCDAPPGDLYICYEYIPGQSASSDPNNVLMYEKPDNHPNREGGNVLFQDAHVEWVTPYSRVLELVAETKKRLDKKANRNGDAP